MLKAKLWTLIQSQIMRTNLSALGNTLLRIRFYYLNWVLIVPIMCYHFKFKRTNNDTGVKLYIGRCLIKTLNTSDGPHNYSAAVIYWDSPKKKKLTLFALGLGLFLSLMSAMWVQYYWNQSSTHTHKTKIKNNNNNKINK